MVKLFDIFKANATGQVAMFTRLFCLAFALQILLNFLPQLRYFNSNPARIYAKSLKLLGAFKMPAPSQNQFIFSGALLILSLIMAGLGAYTRVFLIIALCSYFIYFNAIASLAYVQRKTNLAAITLIILIVSQSAGQPLHAPGTTWELILVKTALSQMYLSAGLQKLKHGGLSWANGKSFQAYLIENYLWSDRKAGLLLARNLPACAILSTLVLVFELSFWLLIFFPGMALVYVPLALIFHLGTYLTMRINYLKYLGPVYLVFITDFWGLI